MAKVPDRFIPPPQSLTILTPGRLMPACAVTTFTLALCVPGAARAHVKWFTVTNVHDAPQPLREVLTPAFVIILSAFVLIVFLGFLLDDWIARRWPAHLSSGFSNAETEQRLVRAATAAYFIGASDVGRMMLTPELQAHAPWIGVVQFLSAFFLIWRRTCVLTGLGIILLYADAVHLYGVFHLTDYVFFPCLAVYLGSLSLRWPRLERLREPLLVSGLAFSLAWTAIEKFLYPQWTYAVIATHPSIGLGLPNPLVVVVAGFVEFTLAFYLVAGRGLLRFGGLVYALIFIMAMPVFGKLDVYGHLIIVATLGIVVIRGTTPMQDGIHLSARGTLVDSAWIVTLYIASLIVFFASYYGLQKT